MRTIGRGVLTILLSLSLNVTVVFAQSRRHPDDRIYDRLVTIWGTISGVRDQQRQREPSLMSGAQVFFIRVGCKQCIFAAESDAGGKYKITVSRGRYRVMMRDILSEPSVDVLTQTQPRYVDARSSGGEIKFDINIRLPESQE